MYTQLFNSILFKLQPLNTASEREMAEVAHVELPGVLDAVISQQPKSENVAEMLAAIDPDVIAAIGGLFI